MKQGISRIQASVAAADSSDCSSDPPITMTQHDTAGPLLPAVLFFSRILPSIFDAGVQRGFIGGLTRDNPSRGVGKS